MSTAGAPIPAGADVVVDLEVRGTNGGLALIHLKIVECGILG